MDCMKVLSHERTTRNDATTLNLVDAKSNRHRPPPISGSSAHHKLVTEAAAKSSLATLRSMAVERVGVKS
eukprot:CAMPEP_0171103482 /NCGR_PEP_ID=MMETSP0766_2-20121228/58942_1 /TAXON_ID=439317 /ORGANISM="Gambierdiscus australes, Strain CAWD 149" /LENGTH=69 /DNA_ID=CAMNT_0011563909 /DNA_START=386 /DNA_END=592 /DNA_ORIENTATION=-